MVLVTADLPRPATSMPSRSVEISVRQLKATSGRTAMTMSSTKSFVRIFIPRIMAAAANAAKRPFKAHGNYSA